MARILLVEDEPLVLDTLLGLLEYNDHDVLGVRTVGAARNALETKNWDLALIDCALPDGRGIDLGDDLRRSRVRCGFMTGWAVVAHELTRRREHHLQKPFTPEQLDAFVSDLLLREEEAVLS